MTLKKQIPSFDNKQNYLCQLTSKTNKKLLKKLSRKGAGNITVLYNRILEYAGYKDYIDMKEKCKGLIGIKYIWDGLVSEYLNKEIKWKS